MSHRRRDFLTQGALAASGGLALGAQTKSGGLGQNLDVYREGDFYKVRGRIDGIEKKTAATADEAIQFAVDSLPQGGEVLLQPGSFLLRREIRLGSRVWLRGSGSATALRVAERHDSGVAVSATGRDGATVSDLAIEGGGNGIVLDNCGACAVRAVLCSRPREHGVWLRNNSFLCAVESCRMAGTGQSAIFLEMLYRGGRAGDYVPNRVGGCIVYGGGAGIECSRAIVADITGCEVFQTAGPAFHIRNTSNSILVSGCRSFQIGGDAVVVDRSDEINLSSNIFCWHQGHGIVLRSGTSPTMR